MPACYDYKDTIVEKNQLNKLAFESMRILNPLKVNEDSTWTFIMFADYFQGALYNIGPPLIQKYGKIVQVLFFKDGVVVLLKIKYFSLKLNNKFNQ